jgi:hypothetical protein
MKQETEILFDHKKVGKRLIPPMLQLSGPFHDVKWKNNCIPNLIWIGLLIDKFGLQKGTELSLSIAKITSTLTKNNVELNFALLGSYSAISPRVKNQLRLILSENGELDLVTSAFSDLNHFYPNFPLRFLLKNCQPNQTFKLDRTKFIIESLYYRGEKFAMYVQTCVVYIQLVLGRIQISSSINSDNWDIEEIKNYPETEKSRRVASHIRADINCLCSIDIEKMDDSWQFYFWNRGLKLESCYE